jgi:hypothetical protein
VVTEPDDDRERQPGSDQEQIGEEHGAHLAPSVYPEIARQNPATVRGPSAA